MKTQIHISPNGPVAVIPGYCDLTWDAVRARVRRAGKITGELVLHCDGVARAPFANALMLHRRCTSPRDSAYYPTRFGKRSFHAWKAPKSRAARRAGQWITAKAKALGYGATPPARCFRMAGIPQTVLNLAYRLAAGECTLAGPMNRLP